MLFGLIKNREERALAKYRKQDAKTPPSQDVLGERIEYGINFILPRVIEDCLDKGYPATATYDLMDRGDFYHPFGEGSNLAGKYPLICMAGAIGDVPLLQKIISCGGDINHKFLYDVPDANGKPVTCSINALYMAAVRGQADAIRFLVAAGSDGVDLARRAAANEGFDTLPNIISAAEARRDFVAQQKKNNDLALQHGSTFNAEACKTIASVTATVRPRNLGKLTLKQSA